MIDCHILTRPTDNKAWLEACLESLKNEPVNLFIESGIEGNTALARKNAFFKGNAEFVTHIDPDDAVVPGVLQRCLDTIKQEDVGAYSLTARMNSSGRTEMKLLAPHTEWTVKLQAEALPRLFQTASVVRRSVIERVLTDHFDLLPSVWGQDRCILLMCAMYGNWRCVPEVGYLYRIHLRNTSRTCQDPKLPFFYQFWQRLKPTYDLVGARLGQDLTPSWAVTDRSLAIQPSLGRTRSKRSGR